jgi:hypothetical protein
MDGPLARPRRLSGRRDHGLLPDLLRSRGHARIVLACDACRFAGTVRAGAIVWCASRDASKGAALWATAGIVAVLQRIPGIDVPPDLLGPFHGGLARAWAEPILVLGVAACIVERPLWLAAAAMLGALFYPTAAVLTLLQGVAWSIWLWRERKTLPVQWWRAIGVAVAAVAITAYLTFPPATTERFGHLFTLPEMWGDNRFGPNGMLRLLPHKSLLASMAAGMNSSPAVFALCSIWTATYLKTWQAKGVRAGTALIAAGLVGYVLAYVVLLRLYEPSRFLLYGSWVGGTVSLATTLGVALKRSARPRLAQVVWLFVGFQTVSIRLGVTVKDVMKPYPRPPSELLSEIRALPPSAVIAGRGEWLTWIPLLTERSVFTHALADFPYHTRFAELMRTRNGFTEDALLARDAATRTALRAAGATHLIQEKKKGVPEVIALPDRP